VRLLYFTSEDINSGLFNNQVYENILGLIELKPDMEVTLAVINRPWKWLGHKTKIEEMRSKNIKVVYLPFSPPMRYYTSSIGLNKLYIMFFSLVFKLFVNSKQYDLIHCRHYLPSLVCQFLGLKNILFDVRSLSLFEYVEAGKIKQNSKIYDYWLNQEEDLINYVDGISVVSKSMIKYFEQYSPRYIAHCPIIVSTENVYYSEDQRSRHRGAWGWTNNNVYVYSGSFGLYGLNKAYLAKLISLIVSSDSKAKFLFLLSNSESEFNSFVLDFEFDKQVFKYFSVGSDDLFKYLSASDVGIHSLPPQIDSFTRLGTKVVEYWCCGLPTLLNSNVGEAADISRTHGFGHVVELDESVDTKDLVLDYSKFSREEIRAKASVLFDKKVVLRDYLKAYDMIISSPREECYE